MIYNAISYPIIFVAIVSLLCNFLFSLNKKHCIAILLFIISIIFNVPLVKGLSVSEFLFSWFYEPSVLTTSIAVYSLATHLTPIDLKINNKAMLVILIFSCVIIFSSLSILPFSFYHQIDDKSVGWINEVIFFSCFFFSSLFDKKVIMLAFSCLIGYCLHLMASSHLLDYIADIWLLLFGIFLILSRITSFISPKNQPKNHKPT